MSGTPVDPSRLVGERPRSAVLGWHSYGSDRSAERLFLRLDEDIDIEAHTQGDGSLALRQIAVPADLSMAEYGEWEFREAPSEHPLARLVGHIIEAVEGIRWRGTLVGLRLGTEVGVVVLLNQADELFVSNGTLPPDYADAEIG